MEIKTLSTKTILIMVLVIASCQSYQQTDNMEISNGIVNLNFTGAHDAFWNYQIVADGTTYQFSGPEFEIDGEVVRADIPVLQYVGGPVELNSGVMEYVLEGAYKQYPHLKLRAVFRLSPNSPVVRFHYELHSDKEVKLTKSKQRDHLVYAGTTIAANKEVKEIRFSEFNEMVHSFVLSERNIASSHFVNRAHLMGPMLTVADESHTFLMAYEHGSQVPDAFVEFALAPEASIQLTAKKGNYYHGQVVAPAQPFATIWLEVAGINGSEEQLAAEYRNFVLRYMTQNLESRKPYIFYNSWNFQERNKHWYKKPYLADMTMDRMLQEIDVAYKMGIEVFVVDAGWFEKTGDWAPSEKRFPDGLKQVKAKLDGYGMKLGLWFDPNAAAITSRIYQDHKDCVKTIDGKPGNPHPIWETEESYRMCLVSRYRDAFADELIRANKELGVTYFKWDAIGQYGCNDPNHFHGTNENSAQERSENAAFEVGRSMAYVVDKLCAAAPDAIVDFDITEGGRSVGLGFLAAGKYFLINNGPYYQNYDIPFDMQNENWNIFFFPGPARGWICRTPLTYDKWLPTVLFLTHYLPDDPYENQSISIGSLILGQNGIWGDLPAISEEGVAFFGKTLGMYKQIRDDITNATMIRDGAVGGSPEVYEKINPETGKGVVVMFSSHAGSYRYITRHQPVRQLWNTRGVSVHFDDDGKATIEADFSKSEAKIIYFGVDETK
jgi:alpha-galactosidase